MSVSTIPPGSFILAVMRPSPFLRVAAFVAAVGAVSACASFGENIACPDPTVGITDSAIVVFIDSVEPPPRRFLIATADYGDSALPEQARSAMALEGPTYMFPSDPAVNQQVRDRLLRAGPFPALLVFYHGMQPLGDTAVDVTFSGRFVTGEWDGMIAPRRAVRMVCASNGMWTTRRPAADTTDAS